MIAAQMEMALMTLSGTLSDTYIRSSDLSLDVDELLVWAWCWEEPGFRELFFLVW